MSNPTSNSPFPSLPPCKFLLDNSTSSTLTLPDGRQLGYAQYGSPSGVPILYQHGLPGSRLEAASLHDIGLELGARIIAVDRPGIGWSTAAPKRTLLDHAADVACLVDELGLDKYAVLGVSGGGPYALCLAARLPATHLKAVAIVCGLGPPDIGMRGANWLHYLGFTYGYRYLPSSLSSLWWRRHPIGRVDLSDSERLSRALASGAYLQKSHAKDAELMTDPDVLQVSLRSGRESFANGYQAVWDDGRIMSSPWGFEIHEVRKDLPVQLWYGKLDSFVPPNHGVQIAARLGGNARLRIEQEEAHAGIWMNWKREVVRGLLESIEGAAREE